MMGSSSGSGYLDPHRVYELVTRLMPRQLLDYLDSVPGASRDLHWQGVKLVGKALLNVVSLPRSPSPEENSDILFWAQLARFHATHSRCCAPQMTVNPSNFTPETGPDIHPDNACSNSGRVLTNKPGGNVHRHAATDNPLSASRSRISATLLPPLQSNTMTSFPTRRAGMRDETSGSNSETHSILAPERHGALAVRKPMSQPSSLSNFPSSPPTGAATSPPQTQLRPPRHRRPLRTCQHRTLSVPELEVEVRGRAPRLRTAAGGSGAQLRPGRGPQPLESDSDPERAAKILRKAVESWSDDEE